MEDHYQWDTSDMGVLQGYIQAAHDALGEAGLILEEVAVNVGIDPYWSGEHKVAFMEWLELLKLFQSELADDKIGKAAADVIGAFAQWVQDYCGDSTVVALLNSIP